MVKTVKKNKYLQYIESEKIVHCGRASSVDSWKKAFGLYRDFLSRASEEWILKHRDSIIGFLNIPESEKEIQKTLGKISGKFPNTSKDKKWMKEAKEKLKREKESKKD